MPNKCYDCNADATYLAKDGKYYCIPCIHLYANDIKRDIDPIDNGQETFPYDPEID